ncbi:hypothetical protein HYV81_04505 [Candidatus Woesearchaeota archaeon]|nr:hypothetical protein [Candidatus Woesearchaeota archaeon]
MNQNLTNATTIFGLGIALYGVTQTVSGWQYLAVFSGMALYTIMGLFGIAQWAFTDGKILK